MSTDRSRFFRFRAFWLTAGLTTAAASWALAVEPTSPPQFLQPVPRSPVVQTQAESPAPNPAPQLRTQMSGGGAPRPMAAGGPKSEVQKQLDALYEQNGRPVLELPDSGIQRQAPQPSAQGTPAPAGPAVNAPALSASQPGGRLPVQPVGQSRPVAQPSGGPVAMDPDAPQPKTWAEAQSMGMSTAKPKKPVGWLEQINPFRKPAPKAPPEEPSEIHYDPRRTAAQAGVYGVQAPPPLAPAAMPPAAPPATPPAVAARPATRLPNYGQLFGMPQTFAPQTAAAPAPAPAAAPSAPFVPAVPAPLGDPFVGVPNTASGSASAPAALPYLEGFGKPVPPPAAPPAHPLADNTAAPPSALPVLDFSKPIPLTSDPAAPASTAVAAAPVATLPAPAFPAPVAALPPATPAPQPFVPQATAAMTTPPVATMPSPIPSALPAPAPAATGAPQAFAPQFDPSASSTATASTPPTFPPASPATAAPAPVPFTGLGLNDPVPSAATTPAPVIITPSADLPLPSAIPAPGSFPAAAPSTDGFVLPVPLPAPIAPAPAPGPGPRTTSDAARLAVPPLSATVPPAVILGAPEVPAAPTSAAPVAAAPMAPPPLAAAEPQPAAFPVVAPPLAAAAPAPSSAAPATSSAAPFPAAAASTSNALTASPPVLAPPLAPPASPVLPVVPPQPTSAAPVVTVPAAPPAIATAAPAAVPSVPAPATAPAPVAQVAEEGFFSEEEERSIDQPGTSGPSGQKPGSPLVVQAQPVAPAVAPPSMPAQAIATPVQASATPVQPVTTPLPPLNVPPAAGSDLAALPATVQPTTVQPAGQPSLQPVPRSGAPASGGKMALISARADRPGLKGFCPVMLRDHRELVDARPEFQSSYGRRVIMLSSAEAKIVFDSDPAKYAPAADGNDVVHFKRTGEELEGSLQHAVWYKGRLYLFVSGESLDSFIGDPLPHAMMD